MDNQIKRTIDLNSPIERVWLALTDHTEFGSWFRLSLHGPFEAGKVTTGEVTYPGYEGLPFWARVEVMSKPHHFSFIWPMDETVAPDDPQLEEKVTLVEFILKPTDSGTRLSIRESGFDRLPEDKRIQIFRDNQGGWDAQTKNIKEFVDDRE